MLSSHLKPDQIETAIIKRKAIRIKTYAMLDNTEDLIKKILQRILQIYGKTNLMEAAYTGIKELAINAVKANMKRIVFQKNNLDINDPAQSEKGHQILKERLTKGGMDRFAQESYEADFAVYIDFLFGKEHFMIEIKNNALLSHEENKRIREKLARAMSYEDIAQFYMDFADDTEGAGLGMTMITMALRAEGIDPHCFTIFTDGEHTTARLEIPITADYVPRRLRFKEESKKELH